MKQAHPHVALLTGGGDKPYALGLAESLSGKGVTIDFIGSDDLDVPVLRANPRVRFMNLRGDQSPGASLPRKVLRIVVYYVRLLSYTLTAKPPIFHILWNNKIEALDRTALMLFYRLCRKHVVLTIHNVNVRKRDGRDTLLNRWTLGVQYRLAEHLFVHTKRMKDELRADFSVPRDKVSVIPFGINETVPNTNVTGREARQRLGLRPKDRVILFFGNIAPYKGLEFLVDAFPEILNQHPDCRLVIAGRPKGAESYWAGIRKRILDYQIDPHVLQHITYIPDGDTEIYFKAADVLVLPYTHVFQSGVLFLGYNFGLPVVASDVASLRDDIAEGETGFVFEPGNAQAVAAALKRYFSSELFRDLPNRRARIRRLAAERHSWTTVAETTVARYRDISGQNQELVLSDVARESSGSGR